MNGRDRKRRFPRGLLLPGLTLLGACGQKGDLYLPETGPAATPAAMAEAAGEPEGDDDGTVPDEDTEE